MGIDKVMVAVLGWYGHGNFGDELVLEGIKHLFHDDEVTVFNEKNFSFTEVNKHDLFVFGGGELVGLTQLFLPSPWVNKIKVPKIALGVGVNSKTAWNMRHRVKRDLAQFNYIGVRDSTALKILQGIRQLQGKTGLYYDCAYSVPLEPSNVRTWLTVIAPTDRKSNKHDKGVTRCNTTLNSVKWLTDTINLKCKTVFVPFGTEDNNDFETCLSLAAHVDESEVWCHSLNIGKVASLFSHAELVVAYRLHAMILAHMLDVPYVFYPYHWKLTRVYESIKNVTVDAVRVKQKKVLKDVLSLF